MAAPSLSIKLRCTSWQQLATIYRRDLSRGSMFLKASSQPPLGTLTITLSAIWAMGSPRMRTGQRTE